MSVLDILVNDKRLPFTLRPAWFSPNIKDVKRYLNVASVSKDGLLVIQRQQPLSLPTELIVVPSSVLDGLLTALHIKLDHPPKHQLKMVVHPALPLCP